MPLLLDLFCGAGGCAVGYHRAGFDVVGVDIVEQKNYPYEFRQDDALEVLRGLLNGGAVAGYHLRGLRRHPRLTALPGLQRGEQYPRP